MKLTRRTFVETAARLAPIAVLPPGVLAVGRAFGAPLGPAPSYISSLTDYQVRALTGTFAPASGAVSVMDATPQEWRNAGAFHEAGLIYAWTGGGKGNGTKLMLQGGGHTDGDNNGLYIYDFDGGAKPNGWVTPVDVSAVAAVRGADIYSDGRPASLHSYDGLIYARHNETFYRFLGVPKSASGGFTNDCWKYNLVAKQWTQLPDFPGAGGATTFYSETHRKIFVAQILGSTGAFLRCDTDTWSGGKNLSSPLAETCAAWDPTRNRGIVLGLGTTAARVVALDFAAETCSVTTLGAVGGDTSILNTKCSIAYDSGRDSYWLFGGASDDIGWDKVFELNANGPPWTLTAHSLTGDAIVEQNDPWEMRGSYGRFVFMEQWRAIGIVASHDTPTYVIKLPVGQTAVVPKAPTSLSVA